MAKSPYFGSAVDSGKFVAVTATTVGAAQTLHEQTESRTERVRIDAWNNSASKVDVTIVWVGTTSPDDEMTMAVPAKTGPVALVPGWLLISGGTIKAYAASPNVVNLYVENS